MPYQSNKDLPNNVKNVLPEVACTIFRKVFNNELDKTGSEDKARKAAWGAIKSAGYEKNEKTGVWS